LHPILFEIGPVRIYTYGFFIALAFITGILWSSHEAKRLGENPERIMDLGFLITISAIVGARILFILLNFQEYLEHPSNIVKIWEGGLVFHGGLIASILAGLFYFKKKQLRPWKYADILSPALALGQVIGRIGCLMAGCCYGRETSCPWGIRFTDPHSLATLNVPLHPTQIYESIGTLLIFVTLLGLRKRKSFEGQVFWVYIALYSIARFTIDFFRGDETRPFFYHTLSLTQVLGVVLFASSIYMLWALRKKVATKHLKRKLSVIGFQLSVKDWRLIYDLRKIHKCLSFHLRGVLL
jgi:phosphatidylglycerol:prolipoprotein diacylglycerol transferase